MTLSFRDVSRMTATLFLAAVIFISLLASPQATMTLRVYEGSRVGQLPPASFITSSYIQPTFSAHLRKESDLMKEKEQIKITFNAIPPRLVKMVDPVYHPTFEESGASGSIILNVRTDQEGNVKNVMVLRAIDDDLKPPALEAVRKWKYEPYLVKGEAKEVVFTANLRVMKK